MPGLGIKHTLEIQCRVFSLKVYDQLQLEAFYVAKFAQRTISR